jgi:hypothetical protein
MSVSWRDLDRIIHSEGLSDAEILRVTEALAMKNFPDDVGGPEIHQQLTNSQLAIQHLLKCRGILEKRQRKLDSLLALTADEDKKLDKKILKLE